MAKENEINYYEILSKLRDFEYKLLSVNQQEKSSWDLDVLLLQAKSLIFEHTILKEEFKKRQQAFYKNTQTTEYKERYTKWYEAIKKYMQNKTANTERVLTYYQPYTKERYFSPDNANVEKDGEHRFFIDRPEYYYYPSILADKIALSGILPDVSGSNDLKICGSLTSFYYAIDPQIVKLNIIPDNLVIKTKTDYLNMQSEITEGSILIPKDLEFFITSGDIKCGVFTDFFKLFFYANSICYVLRELQNYIQECIYKNEYSPNNIPDLTNKLIRLKSVGEDISINNQLLNLTSQEFYTLKAIVRGEDQKDISNLKDYVSKINKKAVSVVNCKLLQKLKRKSPYTINERIFNLDNFNIQ